MIEVVFAIILGFALTSTLCGLVTEDSRSDRVMGRALLYLMILAGVLGFLNGQITGFITNSRNLIMLSFVDRYLWLALGAALAIAAQLWAEGHAYTLWVKLHPQSAPTPEVQMGQRAQVVGFRKKRLPATLVGTSSEYLNTDLDLRTETLIRLCYSTFEQRGPVMMSRLESQLGLGTGRRQKAFHKIVAGHRGRPKTKRIVHRYWRSVNGSSRLSQAIFGDLCKLARDTHNRDAGTIDRLSEVGTALGLTVEEMGRAIHSSL